MPFVSRGRTGAVKAEVTYNHAEGVSMAQNVIMYSNVGCGPCQQAIEDLAQKSVPLPISRASTLTILVKNGLKDLYRVSVS